MDFDEQFYEIQPHGKLLVLRLPEGKSVTSPWPVSDHLRPFFSMPKPYVGLVVDVGDNNFTFCSSDLTALLLALPRKGINPLVALPVHGEDQFSPCIVVIRGDQARRFQAMLDIVRLNKFIQITDSFESALASARASLKASGRGYPALMANSSRAAELPAVNKEAEPPSDPVEKLLPDDEPPETKRPQVFLAHAFEDKDAVRRLYSQLKSNGLRPWLDEIDLMPGQNWPVEIPKAIDQSDIFIACLSAHSVKKQGYVQKEFRLALNAYAEKPPGSIYLIPAKLDDCEVPDLQLPHLGISLRDIQWIELWRENGFERLINAIRHCQSMSEYEPKAPKPKAVSAAVRIVDISFSGDEKDLPRARVASYPVWMRSRGNFVQIDLKLRNVSPEVAFLKHIIIHIDQLWALEGFGYIGAAIPPSAEYDVELPIRKPPFSVKHAISQSIEPNGVDRFLVTLHPQAPDHLFVAWLEIFYNEDDKSVRSDKIIFATRGGPFTFPTASEQMLLDMDQAVEENDPHLKTDWKAARARIMKNNQVRETIVKIGGVKNEIAVSFEQGEPIVHGFSNA